MRRLVSWIAGALVIAGALSGCGIVNQLNELAGGDPEPTTTVTPATFSQPLELRPVTELSTPPCASGLVGDASGAACYRLSEETLTIERVKNVKTDIPKGSTDFAVLLTLYPDDAKAFGDLTGRLAKEQTPRNQIAIVIDGKVVTAPAVMEAITGGEIQIAGNFSRSDADKLVEQLKG